MEQIYHDTKENSLDNSGGIRTGHDHAALLHDGSRGGDVVLCLKSEDGWSQFVCPVKDLPDVLDGYSGLNDCYITQARFAGRRTVNRLREVNALWADVDFYGADSLAGLDPRKVLELAVGRLEREGIPPPTLAIFSGRGLYLVWLHSPIPRAALPRWSRCQATIQGLLNDLGADPAARDAARVLRLVGTRNSKTGAMVEAITPAGEPWGFDALCEKVIGKRHERGDGVRDMQVQRALKKPHSGQRIALEGYNASMLWESRLADLQTLRELRHGRGAIPDGHREPWLFLAAVGVSYIATPATMDREIDDLILQAAPHWSEGKRRDALRSVSERSTAYWRGEKYYWPEAGVWVDPRYRFRNETIIEWLSMSDEEEQYMSSIISDDTRRQRDAQRKREDRREAGAVTRDDYLSIAAMNRTEAHRLRSEGYKQREIGKRLGVSERWIRELLKQEPGISVQSPTGTVRPVVLAEPVGRGQVSEQGSEIEKQTAISESAAAEPRSERNDSPARGDSPQTEITYSSRPEQNESPVAESVVETEDVSQQYHHRTGYSGIEVTFSNEQSGFDPEEVAPELEEPLPEFHSQVKHLRPLLLECMRRWHSPWRTGHRFGTDSRYLWNPRHERSFT